MRASLLIFIISALLSTVASASNWKFRAREHYEWHRVHYAGSDYRYEGFGNTINFWHEKPFDHSLGFSLGSILTSPSAREVSDELIFGENIRLYSLGAEGKYFIPFKVLNNFFVRGGLALNIFEHKGAMGSLAGQSLYFGMGYEFLLSKKISLAIEMAERITDLEEGVIVFTFTPSVGVHFYNF